MERRKLNTPLRIQLGAVACCRVRNMDMQVGSLAPASTHIHPAGSWHQTAPNDMLPGSGTTNMPDLYLHITTLKADTKWRVIAIR
jgi:hypothetical protein